MLFEMHAEESSNGKVITLSPHVDVIIFWLLRRITHPVSKEVSNPQTP